MNMLLSIYKSFAIALFFFTPPLSTSSAKGYISKLKTAISDNDVNTVHQLMLQDTTDWLTENRGWEIASLAAEKGNLPMIQYIAERELSTLAKKNAQNETIGHIAAEHGHPNITEYFLDKTVPRLWRHSESEIKSLFDLIAEKGYLNCLTGRVSSYHPDDLKRIGRIAAQSGHLDIACYMALEGNAKYCYDFENILATAIQNSHKRDPKTLELFKKLADEWSTVYYNCPNIVKLALAANDTELVQYVAENTCTYFLGCRKYLIGEYYPESMKIAFEENLINQNFLDCLEKRNGTIHGYIGQSKYTICHLAAEHGRLDVIQILAERNASILETFNLYGRTVVDIAAEKGYADIVRYAVRQKPLARARRTWYENEEIYHDWYYSNKEYITAFQLVIEKDLMDMGTLKHILEKEGTHLITRVDDYTKKTVAHIAAMNDNMEILHYFVEEKPCVLSKSDSGGDTILHILARQNALSLKDLGFLVEKGASLLAYNKQEENVPLIASKNGNLELVKFVMEKETSVLEGNSSIGINMAEIAARRGHLHIIKLIMDRKPILLGDTPSILFRLPNASLVLDTLQYLRTACETKIKNWDSRTFENKVFEEALERDYANLLGFVEYDVNMMNEKGEPLIFTAVRRRLPKIFYCLANDTRTNLTALDREGNNILFIAAMNRDLDKMKYILDTLRAPIDLEWRNDKGDTILHVAVDEALMSQTYKEEDSGHDEYEFWDDIISVIEYLVEVKHVNINAFGHGNETALYRATSYPNYEICAYLLDRGADPKLCNAHGRNFWHEVSFPTPKPF